MLASYLATLVSDIILRCVGIVLHKNHNMIGYDTAVHDILLTVTLEIVLLCISTGESYSH